MSVSMRPLRRAKALSEDEAAYLSCGLGQTGGKLPLFDMRGQEINPNIIQSCMDKGFAKAWFANPLKPDWVVCRLTAAGRHAVKRV